MGRALGLASGSHSTALVRFAKRPVKKPPILHFPFSRLAICLDCDACFEIGPGNCPGCGGQTVAPLARFLQPNGNSGKPGKLRRQLLVVARDRPHIYDYLKRMFAGNETLDVIMDRRLGDRRRHATTDVPERRRHPDRHRQEIDSHLRALGWAIVLLDVAREQERERGRPRPAH